MKENKRRILYIIVFLLSGVYVYRNRLAFADIFMVCVFSLFISVMLSPFCAAIERKGMSPSAASILCITGLILCILIVVSAFLPYLIMQSIDLIKSGTPVIQRILEAVSSIMQRFGLVFFKNNHILDILAPVAAGLSSTLASAGVTVASITGKLFISLVFAYYMLRERVLLCKHLMLLVPMPWRKNVLLAVHGSVNAMMGYLSCMIKTSAFVFAMMYPGLLLLGIPNAFFLSVFMGFFEVLPYIGPIFASIPILLCSIPLGISKMIAVLFFLILVQQIEGNLISPYLAASSTSLHPLTAFFSVFVFGHLIGFWGIVFAIPIVVVSKSLYWSLSRSHNLMNA